MKKEIFSIPNLMGYFRILMIPVFLILYLGADSEGEYLAAFLVLAVSLLTDFLDGKIARRFDMVTELGKALDPVADKLTQGALTLAVISNYPVLRLFLLLFLLKECYMMCMGLYLRRKKQVWNGAAWHGKLTTFVTDVGIFLLLLLPGLSYRAATAVMAVMLTVMIFSLIKYIRLHILLLTGKERLKKGRLRFKILGAFLILAYLLLGGSLPYAGGKEVSGEYQQAFETVDFYSDTVSCDRAAVVEENERALEERIRLIEHAKERIILSTFDFRSDISGTQMTAALLNAAQRGVQVQILIDGFNFLLRMDENPVFLALALDENVQIKVYNPINPLTPWKAMSRMHDKYVIADEEVYLLGGRNTFDYFLGGQPGYKNYDRDVLVYRTGSGDSVKRTSADVGISTEMFADAENEEDGSVFQLLSYFTEIWNKEVCRSWNPGTWMARTKAVKNASEELKNVYRQMREEQGSWFEETDYMARTVPVNKVTLLSNPTDLYQKEPRVFYGLCRLMEQARQKVVIHTPYIMCDDWMYGQFAAVCGRNIPVTLMTNSAKNNGNPFGAVDFVLNKQRIMETGLEILEYNGGVSYHGKSLLIDDHISVIGSFNMDMKSVYQDTELMLVLDSPQLNRQLSEYLYCYEQDADRPTEGQTIREELYGDLPVSTKLQRAVIRVLDPWLRFLL